MIHYAIQGYHTGTVVGFMCRYPQLGQRASISFDKASASTTIYHQNLQSLGLLTESNIQGERKAIANDWQDAIWPLRYVIGSLEIKLFLNAPWCLFLVHVSDSNWLVQTKPGGWTATKTLMIHHKLFPLVKHYSRKRVSLIYLSVLFQHANAHIL